MSLSLLVWALCLMFQGYSEHFLSLFQKGCQTVSMPKEALVDPEQPPPPKWILINPALSGIYSLTSPTSSTSTHPLIPSYLALHPPFRFLSPVLFPLSVNNSCLQNTHTPSEVHTQPVVAVSGFPRGLE